MSLNLFEIAAKITLDSQGFESGINKASGQADSLASKLSHGLGNAVKAGAAAMAAGATAAGAALTKLISDSTQAYAQYEQAIGGVETLFGDDAARVMADAQEAYITTGQSATEYMQSVVSTSAALIRSLEGDTKEAARLSNMALRDMSDNVNKFGTSIESLQNAYTGFSRGNFTMLDNLSLGFAGTKEGMQELLDYAYELTGEAFDIDSYADIVEAIHAVQEAMEITGTTAEEASKTIAGSTAAMKASWQNLVAGLATPGADMGQLVNDFASSAVTAAGNMTNSITNAISGIKEAIPATIDALESNWGAIESMGAQIGGALFGSEGLLSGDNLEVIWSAGGALVKNLIDGAIERGGALLEKAPDLLNALFGEGGLLSPANVTELAAKGADLIAGLFGTGAEIATVIAENAPGIITALVDELTSQEFLDKMGDAGEKLVEALFEGDLWTAIFIGASKIVDKLIQAISETVGKIFGVENTGDWKENAGTVLGLDMSGSGKPNVSEQVLNLDWGNGLNSGLIPSVNSQKPWLAPTIRPEGNAPKTTGTVINQTINVNGSGSSPQDVKRAAEKGLEAALRG